MIKLSNILRPLPEMNISLQAHEMEAAANARIQQILAGSSARAPDMRKRKLPEVYYDEQPAARPHNRVISEGEQYYNHPHTANGAQQVNFNLSHPALLLDNVCFLERVLVNTLLLLSLTLMPISMTLMPIFCRCALSAGLITRQRGAEAERDCSAMLVGSADQGRSQPYLTATFLFLETYLGIEREVWGLFQPLEQSQ